MKEEAIPYEKQIFVCTNDMEGEKCSCGDQKGEEVFCQLRTLAKERGVHPRIRVAQVKCLGKCSDGVNVMIYPDNVWYSEVTTQEVNWS